MVKVIRNKFSSLLGDRLLRVSHVAKATGLSRTTLTGLYYRRTKYITFDVLDKLCGYLGCDVADLFEYTPDGDTAGGGENGEGGVSDRGGREPRGGD